MLTIGLIGCGKISERHARLLAGDYVAGARLGAVFDINQEKAKAFANTYKVSACSSIKELMTLKGINVVTILTPSGTHAANVTEVAKYGLPIIVEKPMALTLDDADRMVEACDRHGCKLFVMKQNRFNRPVQRLKMALDNGRFGKLVLGTVRVRWCRRQDYYDAANWRGTWANDGGVLANQASHHIDLLEWMMGPIDSVYGIGSTSLVKIECEDTAVVTVKFKNGALGIIEATTAARPRDLEGSMSILGEKGAVEIGGFAVDRLKTWQFDQETEEDKDVFTDYGTNPSHPVGYGHAGYYNHVVECIVNNKAQLVDGLAGRKSLEVITAIYESIETGKPVSLRFNPKKCRLGRMC